MKKDIHKIFAIPDYISYKNGVMHIHGYPYNDLAEQHGTPCVCISLDRIKNNVTELQAVLNSKYPDYKIFYALKASYFQPVLQTMLSLKNVGIEVLSNLELEISKRGGFPGNNLIFNGIGRRGHDLNEALRNGVIVNIDSIEELAGLIAHKSRDAQYSIGLRVHPEFEGDGNFISKDSKLGMTYEDAIKCILLAHQNKIYVNGISFHIFSNTVDSNLHSLAVGSVVRFMNEVSKKYLVNFKYLDIGGGLHSHMFFNKQNPLIKVIRGISSELKKYKYNKLILFLELGRYIVADATIVLSSINIIKKKSLKKWVVLDIGTNYLIPAPGFNFKVIPSQLVKKESEYYFVDGICSPVGFISNGCMGELRHGDIVAILNAGAYTSVMKEEFVYPSPTHIFFENNKLTIKYKKKRTAEVLKFHNWNEEALA